MSRHHAPLTVLAATLGAGLAGCAISAAQMALPAGLAEQPGLPFEGIGGGQRGQFRAGLYVASFACTDTRLALFDAQAERRAGSIRRESAPHGH